MANRVFDFARNVVKTANTLFGRPWGIPRPRNVFGQPQDGTGTAPLAPSPALNPVSPNPPYTPPFQLRDDPPPEANRGQLREEYAAAQVGLAAYYRSLPMWIDDLTRGLGDDLYARMGLDDQIFTSTRNVVRQVLADGLTLRPYIDDKDDPGYEQAVDYCDRAERMLSDLSAGLPQSMDVILQEALLIAAGMGHKVFELVYEPGEDGWTNLARIKSKPRRSTAFVVNPYNDLVGMLVRLPGMALPALASVTDLHSMPILPLDKFAVLTHLQEDSDPRGNSLWRAAYAQWWEKLQTARDYMRYLGQFAMPSIVGELPEQSTDESATDQFGNVQQTTQISNAQAFVNQLVAWRNGSAMAHPHGAKVYTVFAASTGEAFWAKLDRCDRQIDKVISGQVLAGQESKHGTRAQSEVHQDTAGGNLPYYRGLLETLINRQILRRWLLLNEGVEAARTLCPKATLTKIEEQDRGAMMTSYGSLYSSGVLKPSQLPFVHEQLGLPPCQPEELTSPEQDEGGAAPENETDAPLDAEAMLAAFAFEESKHPRGQPKNKGQFGPGGGGTATASKPKPAPAGGQNPKGAVRIGGPRAAQKVAQKIAQKEARKTARKGAQTADAQPTPATTGPAATAEALEPEAVAAMQDNPAFQSRARRCYRAVGAAIADLYTKAPEIADAVMEKASELIDAALDAPNVINDVSSPTVTSARIVAWAAATALKKAAQWTGPKPKLLQPQAAFVEDAQHHQHAEKGTREGGRFVSKGSGDGGTATKSEPEKKSAPAKAPAPGRPLTKDEMIVEAERIFGALDNDAIIKVLGGTGDAKLVEKSAVKKYETHYSDDLEFDAYGVEVKIEHPKIKRCRRFVGVDANGKKFIYNDLFEVKKQFQGDGFGSELFASEVEQAAKAGFAYIRCHAAGGEGSTMNGHYTWPRLGYDADSRALNDDTYERIQDAISNGDLPYLPARFTIQDIMETEQGRAWWKENGSDLYDARFDLSEGSRSWQVLADYLSERRRRKEHA